ncbi:hypothetical protein [[Clostridium] symbiosum]|uniref:hypothetical protein n=1 Tax=Clostridium symbiosum TaxID=1512 RepID=UPI003A7F406F
MNRIEKLKISIHKALTSLDEEQFGQQADTEISIHKALTSLDRYDLDNSVA